MPINNSKQALAQELIDELGDKKKRAFGMYMGLIKRYGEHRLRVIKSEVMEEFRLGKIVNMPKIFMYKVGQLNKKI